MMPSIHLQAALDRGLKDRGRGCNGDVLRRLPSIHQTHNTGAVIEMAGIGSFDLVTADEHSGGQSVRRLVWY